MSDDTDCQAMHYGDRAGQVPATGEHDIICGTPVLAAIVNPNGLDDYTVDWSAVGGATSYTMQEDDDPLFPSPSTFYIGAIFSEYNIVDQPKGTWYYRVMAVCPGNDSDWSNTESTVVMP